jgi:large subunit ribosomal protein L25
LALIRLAQKLSIEARRHARDKHPIRRATRIYTAVAMAAKETATLATSLPPRLIRFFQRYPPPALFPHLTSSSIATSPQDAATNPTSATPSQSSSPDDATAEPTPPTALAIPSNAPRNSRIPPHAHALPYPNPFLPSKNFTTGRWHGPTFGLRKQADLVKLAVAHDVVDLLPWTIKKPGEKEARRIETGLMVKGTGEGQKVKGKLWERTLKGRLEMRRQAMLNMPAMIQEWKQVSGLVEELGRLLWRDANYCVEGTRTRVEEVAEWKSEVEEIEGRRECYACWCALEWLRAVQWPKQHLHEAFGHLSSVHCSILYIVFMVTMQLTWVCDVQTIASMTVSLYGYPD